jgi:PAP2 superfamily
VDLPELGWLTWRQAIALGLVLLASSAVLEVVRRRSAKTRPRLDSAAIVTREAALVLGLYAAWQYIGALSLGGLEQADAAGLWLADLEAMLGWPSEAGLQQMVLGNDQLVYAADVYYTSLHIPVFVVTLLWVLLFRRESWAFARTTVVILTGMCLAIQFIPVAPPRLLPVLGIVDTAKENGRSVYALVAGANEYAAMPSVHIAWAAAVALIVIVAARTPWRWLVLVYPLATLWVVVVTGNHFIIDGVASVVLLGMAVGITMLFPSQRPHRVSGDPSIPSPSRSPSRSRD